MVGLLNQSTSPTELLNFHCFLWEVTAIYFLVCLPIYVVIEEGIKDVLR